MRYGAAEYVPTNSARKCSKILIARSPSRFSSCCALLLVAVGDRAGQRAASVRDVNAVVGQAHVRQAGQHDQVVGDDARFAQLGHRVQLAAAQHLVAQVHVLGLGFAVVPARQARAHEQLAIERVRDARRQLGLPHGRVRRVIDQRALARLQQPEAQVRPRHQQRGEQKSPRRLARYRLADQRLLARRDHVKRGRLRRGVVVGEMAAAGASPPAAFFPACAAACPTGRPAPASARS